MKYRIYNNNQLNEVSESEYENWLEQEGNNYLLPEVNLASGINNFTIDTDYQGVHKEDEKPLPFVLFIHSEEMRHGQEKESVEHFQSFDELKKRRDELIEQIQSGRLVDFE